MQQRIQEPPSIDKLGSMQMIHKFSDPFNPPALTNFYGAAQVGMDITAIQSITFPPFSGGMLQTPFLYVNDLYLASVGQPIGFIWYPHRVDRWMEYQGIRYSSETSMGLNTRSVLIRLRITNDGSATRHLKLKLLLNGSVTKKETPWNEAFPPSEVVNRRELDRKRGAILFSATQSSAYSLQGGMPRATEVVEEGLIYRIKLEPGKTYTIGYIHAIGGTRKEVEQEYDRLISDVDGEFRRVHEEWQREVEAVFTPGNPHYSGYLPVLVTRNEDLKRIYYNAVLGVIFHKRMLPSIQPQRTYVTLMPHYWQTVTFLWDISLSSVLLALLDPRVLRDMIERWLQTDIHRYVGTEYLSGTGVGVWYAANDYNMLRMVYNYLRYTGDLGWLDKMIGGRKVIDYLIMYATHWHALDINGHGVGDYGGVNNLLECVQTYTHEVASLNAANVFGLRFIASLLEKRGAIQKANQLKSEASQLVQRLQELYVPRKGYWRSRQPDGKFVEVRHCYDFITVLDTIFTDLSSSQRKEMVHFFQHELLTTSWMHALSPGDNDAVSSIRPDHQWTGAYTAWPAFALKALVRLGENALAANWLKGLGRTAQQGPFGQAHMVEEAMPPEAGGARKAPFEFPYICDWACVSSGSYIEAIIEGIFGVAPTLFEGIKATPHLEGFDSQAKLKNLYYQGNNYSVDRSGIKVTSFIK